MQLDMYRVDCSHHTADPILPMVGNCAAGHYEGRPTRATCIAACKHYDGASNARAEQIEALQAEAAKNRPARSCWGEVVVWWRMRYDGYPWPLRVLRRAGAVFGLASVPDDGWAGCGCVHKIKAMQTIGDRVGDMLWSWIRDIGSSPDGA